MDQLHSSIALFVVLLLAALSLGMLAERIRRPYTVTLMLASAGLSAKSTNPIWTGIARGVPAGFDL